MKLVNWWKTRFWWARWSSYAVAIAFTAYAVEDFRGYRALEEAKAEYLAVGLRLDIDEILGPAFPDEDNFAASEFIREAYADPENVDRKQFSAADLPKLPEGFEYGKYHGFQGSLWHFQDQESKEKYESECRTVVLKISPQLSRFFEAANRPFCDWRVVTDPTDYKTKSPYFSLLYSVICVLNFYDSNPGKLGPLPISRVEAIAGNLSAARHLRTKHNLVNHTVGTAFSIGAITTLANAIQREQLSIEDLAALTDPLRSLELANEENIIEFETAVFMSRNGHHQETRQLFMDEINSGNHLVSLPPAPFSIDLDPLNRWLDIAVVRLIPRGWVWQGKAYFLRSIQGTAKGPAFPGYTLFGYGEGDYLDSVIEREEQFQVTLQLALLAIEVEKYRLINGSLPAEDQFKTRSPNIGYGIEGNGQPMLWYSETAPTEKALEAYEEKHLWRYPPPED